MLNRKIVHQHALIEMQVSALGALPRVLIKAITDLISSGLSTASNGGIETSSIETSGSGREFPSMIIRDKTLSG
jgi:hypothetical protein